MHTHQPAQVTSTNKTKNIQVIFSLLFVFVFTLCTVGLMFFLSPNRETQVAAIQKNENLRVGLLETRTSTNAPYRAKGIEIIEEIAKKYNWKIQYTTFSSATNMLDALLTQKVDILVDMVITHHSQHPIHFSQSYGKATPVIAHFPKISAAQKNFHDLFDNQLLVIDRSWQDHLLEQEKTMYPQLEWQELPRYFTLNGLLQSIAVSPGGYIILLTSEFERIRFYYDQLSLMFTLTPIDLGFAFRKSDEHLEKFISSFFNSMQWQSVPEQPLGQLPQLSRASLETFLHFVDTRLPKFIHLFIEAGKTHNLDWRLIAAIAYQESLWKEDAVSPTGVRGLMMLTEKTATELGVKDRTDPRQSVFGGTQYFLLLRNRINKKITEPDRSWFALASYNVGYSHVQDVRRYVGSIGGNKNSWHDINAQLHLLEDPTWYPTSQYGYARGKEARLYVNNIRKYFEILLFLFDDSKKIDTPLQTRQINNFIQTHTIKLVIPPHINPRY